MDPDTSQLLGDCDVMFIGEAPGENEDLEDKPFVGAAGDLLRKTVAACGLNAYNIMFTNAVRCRPPDNKITANAIKYCRHLITDEIQRYNPKVVVLLGGSALQSVMGESGISNWRGTVLEQDGRTYVPTWHPSYIKRGNTAALQDMIADLDKVADLLEGKGGAQPICDNYDIYIIQTAEEAEWMKGIILEAGLCSFDTESNKGIKPYAEGVWPIWVSFAVKATVRAAFAVQLNDNTVQAVVDILSNDNLRKRCHNAKYDSLVIKAWADFYVENIVDDSMLLSSIIDGASGGHGLKELAGRHLNMYGYDAELLAYYSQHPEANPKRGGDMSLVPVEIIAPYTARDSIATLELPDVLEPLLPEDQWAAYHEIAMGASRMLMHIESNGALTDDYVVREYIKAYKTKQTEYLTQIRADHRVLAYEAMMSGKKPFEFNPNSSQQDCALLYGYRQTSDEPKVMWFRSDGKWMRHDGKTKAYAKPTSKLVPIGCGLNPVAYTKTGMPSTEWKAIKDAYTDVPLVKDIRYFKLIEKVLGTYLEPALRKAQGGAFDEADEDEDSDKAGWKCRDSRTRSTYNQDNVVTGRLSSSKPNLQNLPTPEKEPGTIFEELPIRNIFTYTFRPIVTSFADGTVETLDDCCIMSADYANMELRIMAAVSHCVGLKQIVEAKQDPHQLVAEMLYKVKKADMPPEQWKPLRYRAKWVNWTLLFGGSYYTLMRTYGIPEEEAKWIEQEYYRMFPEVLEYRKETIAFAQQHGYVRSMYGRRRYLPYINDANTSKRHEAEREGVNMPIQSTASDTLLMALCIIDQVMRDEHVESMIVNTVHDSVAIDIYPGELAKMAFITKDAMENIATYGPMMFPHIDLSWLNVPLQADIEIGTHYGSLEHYEV